MALSRREQPLVVGNELIELAGQLQCGGEVDRIERAQLSQLDRSRRADDRPVDLPEVDD